MKKDLRQQVMDRQAALTAAIEADPRPKHFSLAAIQLYFIALVVCFCSGDNGFDGTVMGGINTMSQFQAFVGTKDGATKTSIVFGIYTIRPLVLNSMSHAVVQSRTSGVPGGSLKSADSGCSCAGAAAKSYLADFSPAKHRGAYIGLLNFCPSSYAGSPFNRFLVGRGHEARRMLAKYHSATRDHNSPLIDLEMKEIEEKIEIDGQDKRWWDFRLLFATQADRYRAYIVILIGTFGQLSGNTMITYFLLVLLENAGIESQRKRLTLNFVNSGAFTVDHFGRRRVLLAGTIAITVILAIVTGLLSKDDGNSTRANAGIVFVYFFMVIFSYGRTSMQALYPAEVLGYQARAKGLAFLNICAQGSTFINTFGVSDFTIWYAFECALIYFFVAEAKGLTLEEITKVFEQPGLRKYSEQVAKMNKQRSGTIIV
ncbi:uncharacterized protein BT62DRAFT_982240 [Guyanagaster necrorhizus]|uniref:Lactose permease n=1 Tax=Guyanagaster necrorhizus TaxID=856835 RepID=A0A9P7VL24_9AGAR|nr:uncharacterized protein BT62DRAFT_982240 [Guyanagaster necrorhizus MCA 3950]KAG7443086.1 hypothetical protein BT62DRAFT_982240 [Guyanagaster necrorhizus MCA 3950]